MKFRKNPVNFIITDKLDVPIKIVRKTSKSQLNPINVFNLMNFWQKTIANTPITKYYSIKLGTNAINRVKS